jgi:hypothetical protein
VGYENPLLKLPAGQALRRLPKADRARIEEAALTIEQEQEGNAQSLEKLKQLQSILKSL